MWQYQKLSTLIAVGMVAICASTGCATTVEDPEVDAEETADITAENSEALTAAGGWGRGAKFRGGHGRGLGLGLGLGKGFRGGHFDRGLKGFKGFKGGYGGYGYGGYGHGYDDYGYGGYDLGYGDYGYGGYGYGDLGGYDQESIIIDNDIDIVVGQGGYAAYPAYPAYGGYGGYDDCDVGYGDYDAYDDWK